MVMQDMGKPGVDVYRGKLFQRLFTKTAHMEIPLTVVGWKSTSKHTVQKL